MNRQPDHEGEQGRPLTLSQCRRQVFTSLFFTVLVVAAVGVVLVTLQQHRSWYSMLVFCVWGMVWAISLFQSWKQYRLVKQGVAVYPSRQTSSLVPKLLSIPVVVVLSVIVFVIDAMAVFIAGVRVRTLEAWGIAGAVMLPLTLYTGYCWYRIVSEQRWVRSAVPDQEEEGIWPPAPRMPQD